MHIYVDSDACPVKDEVLKVATRHGLPMSFVSNSWMRLPESPLVSRIIVAEGPDAADNWIAERAGRGDIVVTQDIPLAARCLASGARVIGNTGKPYTQATIGLSVALRDLNQHLRETGEIRGLNPAFTARDRSRFLEALEQAVQDIRRAGHGGMT